MGTTMLRLSLAFLPPGAVGPVAAAKFPVDRANPVSTLMPVASGPAAPAVITDILLGTVWSGLPNFNFRSVLFFPANTGDNLAPPQYTCDH
jgi:hypothetical protein